MVSVFKKILLVFVFLILFQSAISSNRPNINKLSLQDTPIMSSEQEEFYFCNDYFQITVTASDESTDISTISIDYSGTPETKDCSQDDDCITDNTNNKCTCTFTILLTSEDSETILLSAENVNEEKSNDNADGSSVTVYPYVFCDDDGDQYYSDNPMTSCSGALTKTKPASKDVDCVDTNSSLYPHNNNPYCDCDYLDKSVENEICDELDNDCDGVIDEGCDCNYQNTQNGECAKSTIDKTGTCVPPQTYTETETTNYCDGLDNDCDGTTDEGCDCTDGSTQTCGTSVGICELGIQECANGIWGTCVDEIVPETEICDGLDNNCDGTTDEGCDDDDDGFIDSTMSCSSEFQGCDNGKGTDCNDDLNSDGFEIHPEASESCFDTIDKNCDEIFYGNGRTQNDCYNPDNETCFSEIKTDDGKILYCEGQKTYDDLDYVIDCECEPFLEIRGIEDGTIFDENEDYFEPATYSVETNLLDSNKKPVVSIVISTNPLETGGVIYQGGVKKIPFFMYDSETELTLKAFIISPETAINGEPLLDKRLIIYIPEEIEKSKEQAPKNNLELSKVELSDEDATAFETTVKEKSSQTADNATTNDAFVRTENSATVTDKSTIVTSSIEAEEGKVLKDVTFAIEIPKCAAELVNEINFENDNFELLDEDPLIAWHFTEVTDKIDLSYEFEKKLDKECLDQLKVLSIVSDVDDDLANNHPYILLLIIPVVLFVAVIVSKFTTQEHVDASVDEEHVLSELQEIIKHRMNLDEDTETILTDLESQGFDKRLIKEAFKRSKMM